MLEKDNKFLVNVKPNWMSSKENKEITIKKNIKKILT